jgi:hypothetical protein
MWAAAALMAWAAAELAADLSLVGSGNRESLRFAAIAVSFCPIVAVLGAKRPQDTAWNFVVLSLWAIVALPAAESFFLHPGQKLSLGDARAWFLWILIGLELINYAPTRFGIAAGLLAAGQIVALGPYLALVHQQLASWAPVAGLVLVAAALLVAWIATGRETRTANELDRAWLDFRDAFGLLWGLRLQERINTVANLNGWNAELTWSGFRSAETGQAITEFEPSIEEGLRTALSGVLRRFSAPDRLG